MRILLAEDDDNISTIARLALEQFGQHKVDLAKDGQTALEMAIEHGYDLILLDRMMPKMNGLDMCLKYKSHPQSHTPIIFLSARCHDKDVKTFCELGQGFIPKPFDPTHLCQQIDEIMKIQEQNQEQMMTSLEKT